MKTPHLYQPPGDLGRGPHDDPHVLGRRLLLGAIIAYFTASVFWTLVTGAFLMLAVRIPLQGYLCLALYKGAVWARWLFVVFTFVGATLVLWWNPLSAWVALMAASYLIEGGLVAFHPGVQAFIRAQSGRT